jgi:ADP-heptose:LPS heptosyltransferase
MDVVVTTDTANAHMAGALGKPTLLLLNATPCWRWMTDRNDDALVQENQAVPTAWKPGEWPVEAVREELVRMVAHG